ncbi:HEPN domain-containing protein [Nibrella viscosa]|uniref:HEPN domain-containing protein n=1 Tax=Nibrella viscosa TaxID=1084524 RepID=A0ABP8K6X6_9BACT
MNPTVISFMRKAYECLDEARILRDNDKPAGTCTRAYYAYSDAVRALLATKGIHTKFHSGAHNLFGLHFVKSGLFHASDGKALVELFEMRQDSDYEADEIATNDDADRALDLATEFLLQAEAYLRQNNFA